MWNIVRICPYARAVCSKYSFSNNSHPTETSQLICSDLLSISYDLRGIFQETTFSRTTFQAPTIILFQ